MLNKVLQFIQDSKFPMEAQLGGIQIEIGLQLADHAKLTERIDETESTLTSLRPTVAALQDQLKTLQRKVQDLTARVEDTEAHSWHNIIHFFGFLESSESLNTELFLEEWLIATVLATRVQKLFSIERGHKISGRPLPLGLLSCTIIACLLNFRDRDLLLQMFGRRVPGLPKEPQSQHTRIALL
ncbi:hypothetical protein NDU88_000314 [Pleurodeles waltl]|uniref:Uncharacterized protein n=1 Tax=Pleurodeles waltl TaxID=8319 RepID=A0AAV7UTQ0_PLEWA|nr:hypothetical protein NDU88_000314 [Pleurodeles waltl]